VTTMCSFLSIVLLSIEKYKVYVKELGFCMLSLLFEKKAEFVVREEARAVE